MERNSDYPIKTVTELRKAFWDSHPQFKEFYIPGAKQNQYKCDIRVSWVYFVEHARRDKQISVKLSYRATL